MPGTSEGAKKAAMTNKQNDPNFYSKIGKKSWVNPERSHVTGFAKLPRETVAELGRRGGKKTKDDYQTNVSQEEGWTSPEEIRALLEDQDSDSPELSE